MAAWAESEGSMGGFFDARDSIRQPTFKWAVGSLVLGVFCFCLGTAEAALAEDWDLSFLVFVGSATACAGACFIGAAALLLLLARRRPYARLSGSDADSFTATLLRRAPAVLRVAAPVAALLAVYTALLLLVHVRSPDNFYDTFPAGCPAGENDPGCNRVALSNPSVGARPVPQLRVARRDVHAAILDWVDAQPRATVLSGDGSGDFAHARFASLFWGFADDFYARLTCSADDDLTAVELQGNLRLGTGDFGVNRGRNEALLQHLQDLVASGKLVPGSCSAGTA